MQLIHSRTAKALNNRTTERAEKAISEKDRKKILTTRLKAIGLADVTVDKLSSCLVQDTFERREELTRLAILSISQRSICEVQTRLLPYTPLRILAKKMSAKELETLLRFLETNVNKESTEEPIEKRVRDYYSSEIVKGAAIVAFGVTVIAVAVIYSSWILGGIGALLAVSGAFYTGGITIESKVSEESVECREQKSNEN